MPTTAPRLARLVQTARAALARNRARAERLVAQLERWSADPTRRDHQMGQALAALKSPALYGALGHRSFEALLRRRGLGSASRAARLIRIAEKLPAAQARSLGW